MNKNILKTTTILTSLAFLTFASLSYAAPQRNPVRNVASRMTDRVNIASDYANVSNDGSDSSTDMVTDKIEVRGDVRGLVTNQGNNTPYDVVDSKTDEVNIKTDSFDQVRDTFTTATGTTAPRDENYHTRDDKTDEMDAATDTINAVKNNRPKPAQKKQSFFSRLFGASKKKTPPTEEGELGTSGNTYNRNMPPIPILDRQDGKITPPPGYGGAGTDPKPSAPPPPPGYNGAGTDPKPSNSSPTEYNTA